MTADSSDLAALSELKERALALLDAEGAGVQFVDSWLAYELGLLYYDTSEPSKECYDLLEALSEERLLSSVPAAECPCGEEQIFAANEHCRECSSCGYEICSTHLLYTYLGPLLDAYQGPTRRLRPSSLAERARV